MERHVTPLHVHPPLLEWGKYEASLHTESQRFRTTLRKVVNMNMGRLYYATSKF
jgi:hypothetical protein